VRCTHTTKGGILEAIVTKGHYFSKKLMKAGKNLSRRKKRKKWVFRG